MKVQIIIFLLIIILILSTCLIIILKIALNKNYTIKIGGNLDRQINNLIGETNSLLRNNNKLSFTNISLERELQNLLTRDFFIDAEKSFKELVVTKAAPRTIYQHIMNLISQHIINFLKKNPSSASASASISITVTPSEAFKTYIYGIYEAMNLNNFTPEQMSKKQALAKVPKGEKTQGLALLKEEPKLVKNRKMPIKLENTRLPIVSDDIPRITSFDEFLKLEDKDAEIKLCNNEKELLHMDIEELHLEKEILNMQIDNLQKSQDKEIESRDKEIESRDKKIELCNEANRQLKNINNTLNITNWDMDNTNSLLTQKNISLKLDLEYNKSILNSNKLKLDNAERVINENTNLKMNIQNSKLRYKELYNILNEQRQMIKEQNSKLQEQASKIQELSIYQKDVQMSRALAMTTSENNKSLKLENEELKSKLKLLENVASKNVFLDEVQKENIKLKLELENLNNGINRTLIELKKNPLIFD